MPEIQSWQEVESEVSVQEMLSRGRAENRKASEKRRVWVRSTYVALVFRSFASCCSLGVATRDDPHPAPSHKRNLTSFSSVLSSHWG